MSSTRTRITFGLDTALATSVLPKHNRRLNKDRKIKTFINSDQSVSTDEDTMIQITLSATDIEGDPLTYSIVDQPTNGTAVLTGNTVDYTPDGDYNGPDSFTFKVNDGTTDNSGFA